MTEDLKEAELPQGLNVNEMTRSEGSGDNSEDTPDSTLVPQLEVLAIGTCQKHPKTKRKSSVEVDKGLIFYEKCQRHFSLLLMGTPTHTPTRKFLLEYLGVQSHYENGQLKGADFYCHSPGYWAGSYFRQVIYSKAVLHTIRTRVKPEYWTSKNTVEMPIRKEKTRDDCRNGNYIYGILNSAYHEQKVRIVKFLLYLHREHAKGR